MPVDPERPMNNGKPGANGPRSSGGPDAEAACDSAWLVTIGVSRDRAAFVALFGRYAPRLKSWFVRSGASAAQAEDLVQETMLAVWRAAARYNPAQAGAAAWIFAIARNQRIDAWRRTPRLALDPDDPSMAPPEPEAPDSILDTAGREQRLREALRDLPAEQADVIRLSFFEDRPHAEIERALGIPLGTVKSRLRLAMRRLRDRLGDLTPPENPPARRFGQSGPGRSGGTP